MEISLSVELLGALALVAAGFWREGRTAALFVPLVFVGGAASLAGVFLFARFESSSPAPVMRPAMPAVAYPPPPAP